MARSRTRAQEQSREAHSVPEGDQESEAGASAMRRRTYQSLFAAGEVERVSTPRKPRQWRMHVCDAGPDGETATLVRFKCQRCGHESEWTSMSTVTEAKRGLPCPVCNSKKE